MINENRLIELLEDEILRIDTESTPGCGNLYGRDASVMKNTLNFVIDLINEQPKVGEWIPCSERLPEEHDSFFVNFKGTEHWIESMYEKNSNPVLATIEYKNGRRKVCLMRTIDGEWDTVGLALKNGKVLAWQSFPEPFCE